MRVNEVGVGFVTLQTEAGTAELALDTGAAEAIQLRPGTAILEGLNAIGRRWSANAYGRLSRRPVYDLREVHIGGRRIEQVRAVEMRDKLPEIVQADGLLGLDLFDGRTLDIDLPAGRLGVFPSGELPSDFIDQEWVTVPIVDDRNGYMVEIRVDDHPEVFRMVLDTGAVAYGSETTYGILDLPRRLKVHADNSVKPPVYQAELVHLGSGTIGSMAFLDLRFPEPPGADGFLGNALFRNHRVVIDPGQGRVHVADRND